MQNDESDRLVVQNAQKLLLKDSFVILSKKARKMHPDFVQNVFWFSSDADNWQNAQKIFLFLVKITMEIGFDKCYARCVLRDREKILFPLEIQSNVS